MDLVLWGEISMKNYRGEESSRTYEEINLKIKKGDVSVMTAEEFVEYAKTHGIEKASKEIDVVTTGTFGAMCSSGAFLNFGHSDPPIKMFKCWLNDVPVYKGLAAVDAYIGATSMSETKPFEYGGGHVIEDLVSHKEIELRAESYGTDCYPRRLIETTISIEDLNQAMMVNPRNAYQRYNAATNSSDRVLYTYMGTLLPRYGNVTFSGTGQLSPLYKDKSFETIGIGTRIFLGGGMGYVIGEGTQHNPQNNFGTLMVKGNLKKMNPRYLRGAAFYKYGTTLYIGIGIAIPIINERVAKSASLSDEEIFTEIVDYGVPSRDRPKLRIVSYAELKSGKVLINDKSVPSSSLSSYKYAKEIAETLKKWIQEKEFFLVRPIELLPIYEDFKPLKIKKYEPTVKDVMTKEVITAKLNEEITTIAEKLVKFNIDHVPIVNEKNKLIGIVTSWDIAKAVAKRKKRLEEVMTTKVITARENEPIEIVAKRLSQYNISGMPVVDNENHVIGIVTTNDLAKLLRREKQ
ncbi:MAG: homocysteine biosynthesis protein [Candidatus Bathyarchaeia archaeon]